jgi:uncharacterized protein (TIGR00730 family)
VFKTICVYCSSSKAVAPIYFEAAAALGRQLAERNDTLIFGGSQVGLMGAVARSAHQHGGRVIGVIPQAIHNEGVTYDIADELIITEDLRARKAVMEARADAFLVLPGGFGTLEELFEILTLKQIRLHVKPVILINIAGFFDPLAALFAHLFANRFAHPDYRRLYHIAPGLPEAFAYLDSYAPAPARRKWE